MTNEQINLLMWTVIGGYTPSPSGAWQDEEGNHIPSESMPDYAGNANVTLKALEGEDWSAEQIGPDKIYVRLIIKSTENANQQLFRASSKTFCHAVCDVLLQSKGADKLRDQPI